MNCLFHHTNGNLYFFLTLRVKIKMLHGTLVRLDPRELESIRFIDGYRDINYLLGRRYPTTARSTVNLYQTLNLRTCLCCGGRELGDIAGSSTHTIALAPNIGIRAKRANFAGSRT